MYFGWVKIRGMGPIAEFLTLISSVEFFCLISRVEFFCLISVLLWVFFFLRITPLKDLVIKIQLFFLDWTRLVHKGRFFLVKLFLFSLQQSPGSSFFLRELSQFLNLSLVQHAIYHQVIWLFTSDSHVVLLVLHLGYFLICWREINCRFQTKQTKFEISEFEKCRLQLW